MNALENWRDKLNQVAIVDHRERLELLAMEEHRFWQLDLESHE